MNTVDFTAFFKNIVSERITVLNNSITKSKFIKLDLSETNHELEKVDVSSSDKLGNYITNFINKYNAQVAYGGYLESRNIYKRSHHFNSQAKEERNIHLGIDLWCDADAPIYTPFDAVVHSFKNNMNHGDYGPTIILEHKITGVTFYTLYGHLSLKSIQNLEIGKRFKQGEKIATLGDASINGDYPPHLHFQIIIDIQDFKGDYPGVCSKKDLVFYKANCPDPNLLLKLNI